MSRSALAAALFGAATVSAHGWIRTITIGSDTYTGYNPTIAPWQAVQDSIAWQNWATDTGFVPSTAESLASSDINCHLDSVNAIKSATVAAGSEVKLDWTSWPASHKGPIMDYMARCENDDCLTVDKETLKWFKIAEMGQLELGAGNGTVGYWADDVLAETDWVWTVTIPADLAPGSYVLRHELLSLHSAYDEGGAQFYPQCINLVVTGNGTESPEGVLGPELYTSTDPGVIYNVYNDEMSPEYQIPGPSVCML
ncbi:glycoside hydrolase [Stachybotrys elegans]|uniref:lytic cellulose monooxygenase (C4-dehydrogenating) n=1 Tax=Stachybotrys elegans TaxID=80388 RepID=A0A8K0SGT2_9HYPO|nr:glycoside hydrolase [Stachybotrys elegans]